MGLFDGLKAKNEPTFNPQSAIMTIIIAAIRADGNASDEEVRRLRSTCARSPIFANNTTEEDDALIDFAVNVDNQFGSDGTAKAAETLTPELRETAFSFATEIVLVDGIVSEGEDEYLTQLAGMLGVSDDLARRVIEVTLIRGRGV